MQSLAYPASPVVIRDDIIAAHQRAWQRLARPGTWWSGAQRVAIAAETRQATACAFCQQRQASLTPAAMTGAHAHLGALPHAVVEVIHRIRIDASRLTEQWYNQMRASGLSDAAYVETVGIVATTIAIDTFTAALGLPLHALPTPIDGFPSRSRPAGATTGLAWVPTVAPEAVSATEHDLYANLSGVHIHQALSLVPAEVTGFFDLDAVHYLPDAALRDFGHEYRAITHAQIELLAARVSVLNQCFY